MGRIRLELRARASEWKETATVTVMNTTKSIGWSVVIAVAMSVLGAAAWAAEIATQQVPENARAKGYGSGWECSHGYRATNGTCEVVQVPANAYPTRSTFGAVWKCKRGYVQENETCAPINIPEHGYLGADGDEISCNRGYLKVEEDCVAVQVPANGYLWNDTYGRGWACERGFLASNKSCEPIEVPKNAHLDFFGIGWVCDPSYRLEQGQCVGE